MIEHAANGTHGYWLTDAAGARHAVMVVDGEPGTYCGSPPPPRRHGSDGEPPTRICPDCFLIGTVRRINLADG